MAKRNLATLCAALAIFSFAHAVAAENDFYRLVKADVRRCAWPRCGGYFIEKVNVEDSEVYVAGFDYSLAPKGVQSKVDDFLAALYNGPIVVFGHLVPLPSDSRFHNLQVLTVYLGMPGQTSNLSGLTFYTLNSTKLDKETTMVAQKLNAGNNTSHTLIAQSSVKPVTPAPFLDLDWQLNHILYRGALVAGNIKTSNSLSTIQIHAVYIQVPVRKFFCPLELTVILCDKAKGGRVVYDRTPFHCFHGSCIYKQAMCPLWLPSCSKGYQLAGWPAAPGGCNKYACDPIFAPGPSILGKQ